MACRIFLAKLLRFSPPSTTTTTTTTTTIPCNSYYIPTTSQTSLHGRLFSRKTIKLRLSYLSKLPLPHSTSHLQQTSTPRSATTPMSNRPTRSRHSSLRSTFASTDTSLSEASAISRMDTFKSTFASTLTSLRNNPSFIRLSTTLSTHTTTAASVLHTAHLTATTHLIELSESAYLDPLYRNRTFRLLTDGRLYDALSSSPALAAVASSNVIQCISSISAAETLASNRFGSLIFGAPARLKDPTYRDPGVVLKQERLQEVVDMIQSYREMIATQGWGEKVGMDFGVRMEKCLETLKDVDEILEEGGVDLEFFRAFRGEGGMEEILREVAKARDEKEKEDEKEKGEEEDAEWVFV